MPALKRDSGGGKRARRGPKVSVYIVSHNYGHFLRVAIESVLRQTYDDWELLIINDGSTDDTETVMRRYEGDERIRVFTTPGIGLPRVCNLAVREARGEYIIRLDADDIFDENILIVLSNYLDRSPDCAMVFPDYYLIDEFGDVFSQERREKLYAANHVLDHAVMGACCLIRTSVIRELGGYREDLGAQDGYDIWSKLIKHHRSDNVNIPLYYYRRHGENLTSDVRRILHSRREIRKDVTADLLARYRPITVIVPCRRNYDFCRDLWRQEINGKTLLERTLGKCVASPLFDHIIVTADTDAVRTELTKFSDPRLAFFPRDRSLTYRSVSIVATLEKIIRDLGLGWEGTTVLTYVETPLKEPGILEEAIHTLVLNGADSAMAVEEISYPVFQRLNNGLVPVNRRNAMAGDIGKLYRETMATLATRNKNIKAGSLTGASVVNFVAPEAESFGVTSEQQLEVARILAAIHDGRAA